MPVMDGFDFLKELKILEPDSSNHPPIIMLTTSDLSIDREMSEDLGASLYLMKFLDRDKVNLVLEHVLSNKNKDNTFVFSLDKKGNQTLRELSQEENKMIYKK